MAQPRVDPSPFALGDEGPAAALCLHGLSGTPYEVRPLGEALAGRGIHAVGPALPGHNATPQELATLSHLDWLDAARSHLRALRERHDRVFIVGLSMGGLLALSLAAEDGVDALAVIATPLRLSRAAGALVPILKWFHPFARKPEGSDIRDEGARRRHPSYEVMPLASVHELQHLQRRVRRSLARVSAPILAAHGAHDRTARPSDSHEILARVSSAARALLICECSAHNVAVDFDGPRLARAVAAFLARYA